MISSRSGFKQPSRAEVEAELLTDEEMSSSVTGLQQRMEEMREVMQTRAMVVRELLQWLPKDEQLSIKLMRRDDLIQLCELGRAIRNEYELWSDDHPIHKHWTAGGQDANSMCHPDQFSFSCIVALWEALQ